MVDASWHHDIPGVFSFVSCFLAGLNTLPLWIC
jgi:hypothetical protein